MAKKFKMPFWPKQRPPEKDTTTHFNYYRRGAKKHHNIAKIAGLIGAGAAGVLGSAGIMKILERSETESEFIARLNRSSRAGGRSREGRSSSRQRSSQ